MRTFFRLLAFTWAIALLGACGDDFSESTAGTLTLRDSQGQLSDNDSINFNSVTVGDPQDVQVLIVSNSSDEGEVKIGSITMVTESPWVTISEGGTEPRCDDEGCHFDEYVLGPNQSHQYDLFYNPLESTTQCGEPLPGQPENACGYILIKSAGNDNVMLNLIVPELGGELQVCTPSSGSCGEQLQLEYNPASVGDAVQERTFTIQNVGANVLQIHAIEQNLSPSEEFVLDGDTPPYSLNPTDIREYTLSFEAQSDDASRFGTLVVRSDSGTAPTSTISIQISGANDPVIEIDPTSLSFPNVEEGGYLEKTLTITNAGGSTAGPLTVSLSLDPSTTEDYTVLDEDGAVRAGSSCQGAAAPETCTRQLVIPRSSSHVIAVAYNPQTAEATNAILRISSNDTTTGTLEVPLTASAAVGFLAADPSSLTWTDPLPGQAETKSISLTNMGDIATTITGVRYEFSPADGADLFTISPDPSTIALDPEASQSFEITFTRDSEDTIGQAYSGSIIFENDGSSEVVVTAAVEFE